MVASPIRIIAFDEDTELARYSLEPGEYLIGRASSCHLQLNVQGVSREHARLIVDAGGGVALEDRGSANGTFVDQWRVRGRVNVHPDQTIKVGAVTLLLEQSSAAADNVVPVSLAAGSDPNLPTGSRRSDRYDIGEELAQGGMGAILQAREVSTRRTVAMKVMLDKVSLSARHRLRFIEEAQITAQLEHPNIVPVHELGVDSSGHVFYTMKLVKGITLKKIIQLLRQGVPATVAKYQLAALLTVFQKVCDALAFAHSKGVIHRDLKPANIMVGYFGEVLVMDWGLAKVLGKEEATLPIGEATAPAHGSKSVIPRALFLEQVSSARRDEGDAFATMDGAVIGTPHYMSPEQAGGNIDNLDVRSDIFALGAILYELLTLELPFAAATGPEVIERIRQGNAVPPHMVAKAKRRHSGLPHLPGKEVPASLSAVCMKALAHDPAHRYSHVKDLQADLAAYQTGFATTAEATNAWKHARLFVQRHKSASISVVAIVTLIVCFSIKFFVDHDRIVSERNRGEKALGDLKKTAPSLLQLADSEATFQRFESALQKIDAALAVDSHYFPAYWRRAWILIGMERFAEAYRTLLLAQQKDPMNYPNARIIPLIKQMASAETEADRYKAENSGVLLTYLQQRGASGEVLALSRKLRLNAEGKVQLIKSRIKAWLGDDGYVKVENDGTISLDLPAVANLDPIRGLPINKLRIGGGKAGPASLEAVRGMRLVDIDLAGTNISDLSPVRGMPLRAIAMSGCKATNLSPLRGAPLESVDCAGQNLIDLSALHGAPLKHLDLRSNRITDLNFLRDAPIEELRIDANRITDLSPLHDKPLRILTAAGNSVTDLNPLAGTPIEELDIANQLVALKDLSPLLDALKLEKLRVSSEIAKSLGPLRKHPMLKYICVVHDPNDQAYVPAAEFWKKSDAKTIP